MSTKGAFDPRKRLDEHMNLRRIDLGLTWAQVAERADNFTVQGLHGVRKGTGEIRDLTKARIEKALLWAPRSVDAILGGGDPVLLPVDATVRPGTIRATAGVPGPAVRRRPKLAELLQVSEEARRVWDSRVLSRDEKVAYLDRLIEEYADQLASDDDNGRSEIA